MYINEIIISIQPSGVPVQLPAGFELCEEGDLAESFWILHEGEVGFTPSPLPLLDLR